MESKGNTILVEKPEKEEIPWKTYAWIVGLILSRVYGTWQPITRVLGPNECVY
jgi:hypothetical protein